MLEQLEKIDKRYQELCDLLMDPNVTQDPAKYKDVAKEKSGLDKTIEKYQEYKKVLTTLEEGESVLKNDSDEELRELAELELEELNPKKIDLEEELKVLLLPKDPQDKKNVIVEVRAGTGGDEAGLFAGDLYRMYSRFAERIGWKIEVLSSNPQGVGGFKEIIFMMNGEMFTAS